MLLLNTAEILVIGLLKKFSFH